MADASAPSLLVTDTDLSTYGPLLDLYDGMVGEVALADVLRRSENVVAAAFAAETASIFLLRRETQELEAHISVHNVPRTIRVPVDKSSLAGFCAAANQAFIVPDAYGDLSVLDPSVRFDSSWDRSHNFRTRDMMCAPALFKGDTVGVVQVLNKRQGTFTSRDLEALGVVARVVGYALCHAQVYDDLLSMKQFQREKAKFMSVMVHEFKSPVGATRMMADLLEKGMVGPEKQQQFFHRMSVRLDGLQQLISESLEFSRVESGDVLGEIAVVDLCEHVEQVLADYREPAQEKGLALNLVLPPEPVPVRFDTRGIHLVISNLVSNAVKYTAAGSVDVVVGVEDDVAIIAVTDTGMGIPEKDIPKLFREFYRASNARDSDVEGTGVGLSAIKSIVERFGGELRLKTRQDVGSTFTVRIPLQREDNAEAGAPAATTK